MVNFVFTVSYITLNLQVILTEFWHSPAATDEAFDSEEGLNANRHQEGSDGVALEGNPHKETPLIEGNAKMKTEQNEKELTGNVAHVVGEDFHQTVNHRLVGEVFLRIKNKVL